MRITRSPPLGLIGLVAKRGRPRCRAALLSKASSTTRLKDFFYSNLNLHRLCFNSVLKLFKMSTFQLPPIEGVPTLATLERTAVLDALFEPCEALHTLSLDLLHTSKFGSYNDLIASVGVQLTELLESASTSDTEWLDKILGAHPRLGEKKVESAQSKAEQAQLNTGGEAESKKLHGLNVEYEKAFPGLKYVYAFSSLVQVFKYLHISVYLLMEGRGP